MFKIRLGAIRLGFAAGMAFGGVGSGGVALAQASNIAVTAQPLSGALRAIAQQTSTNILFTPDSVAGLQARNIYGRMNALQAVRTLLHGTRLQVVSDGNGGLLVRPGPQQQAEMPPPPPLSPPPPVQPQEAAPRKPAQMAMEEVVVTGTSIRGEAPIGSNLISFGQPAIRNTPAADVNQVLRAIPSLAASQASGQGGDASDFQPNIHQLGGSASNSTLVLIDGHRTALTGTNHPLVDPSILAPIMLERIEVLPDGASSIYGSDAVAGVINFVTRKHFEGLELNGSTGYGKGYARHNADVLGGTNWNGGGALFSYSYSYQSELKVRARPRLHGDYTARGGTNFKSFACSPATIQPDGMGDIFLSPQSSTAVANTAANSPCDNTVFGDLLPREVRQNIVTKFNQNFGQNLSTMVEFVYSNRTDTSITSRGDVTATVFGTGAQENPFYTNPPGVTATKQTVRWNADDLLGPGAHSLNGAENGYLDFQGEYRFANNWRITLLALTGKDHSYSYSEGRLCTACAYLALNGTTSGGASLTIPSIAGTSTSIQQLPLTPANALDIWNPAQSNRTSAAVLDTLVDSATVTDFYNTTNQFRWGIDGTLVRLPAGPLKAAIGAEYVKYNLKEHQTNSQGTGPASVGGSSLREYQFQRSVKALFGELQIPLVSEDTGIPLMRSLVMDVSGRYDSYSDVGPTFNPKFGVNWFATDGLKLRGSMSRSFVAPASDILGNKYGNHSGSGFRPSTAAFQVTTAAYPLAGLLPGCSANLPVCNISSGIPGIEINNGNPNIKPQIGSSWSLGWDFHPRFAPQFSLSATYFNNKFDGANTAPEIATIVAVPALQNLLTIYPNGATPAQIAAATAHVPQTGALPSTVYYIYTHAQQNILNLHIAGFDVETDYHIDAGRFGNILASYALTEFTRYTVQTGPGTPTYSTLNTTGIISIFPMVQTQMHASLDWDIGPYQAGLYLNLTGGYRNWGANTVKPIIYDPTTGVPTGGGSDVRPNATFDLHLAYDFDEDVLAGAETYLSVLNVFDTPPPFFNSAQAYDRFEANPIGRLMTIGLRTKW